MNTPFELIAPSSCAICGRYLGLDESTLCDSCDRLYPVLPVPPTPDGRSRHAALPFEAQARDAILDLKFGRALWRTTPLARLLASRLADEIREPDAVAHVPLHRRRIRTRGFDQSAQLARALARETSLQWLGGALRRCRHALPQSRRSGADRLIPHGTYVGNSAVRGRAVLLLDDVTTTGNTFDACARALLTAGAASVRCLALASADIPEGTLDAERRG